MCAFVVKGCVLEFADSLANCTPACLGDVDDLLIVVFGVSLRPFAEAGEHVDAGLATSS